MSEETARFWDMLFGGVQTLALVVGGWWAFRRFAREGAHTPRIEFDIECEFFGPHHGKYLAAVRVIAENKGLVEHRFRAIYLRMRGIRQDQHLHPWNKDRTRTCFPEPVLSEVNLVPPKLGWYFVRPGVRQAFSHTSAIAGDIRFLTIHAEFVYHGSLADAIKSALRWWIAVKKAEPDAGLPGPAPVPKTRRQWKGGYHVAERTFEVLSPLQPRALATDNV